MVALQFWGVIFVACKLFQHAWTKNPKMPYNSGDIIILFDEETLYFSKYYMKLHYYMVSVWLRKSVGYKSQKYWWDNHKSIPSLFFFLFFLQCRITITVFLFVSIIYEKLTDCLTALSALHVWKMTRANSCTKYTSSVIKPLPMQATSLAKHYRSAASQFCRSVLHLAGRSQWDGFLKCKKFYLDLMSHRAFV